VLIQSSCSTLPWDPIKQFSSIVGQTCTKIFWFNDPATLIELFAPLQKYLPGHHIPDMSAHVCKDIKELLVQTKHSATISNEDVLDLAFVLDPGFIAKKTNIVLLGMESIYKRGREVTAECLVLHKSGKNIFKPYGHVST